MTLFLNEAALQLADRMVNDAARLNIAVSFAPCGARLIDCGVRAAGGREAGLRLAEVCLAGSARVDVIPGRPEFGCPDVMVKADHPLYSCMFSQYAGWQLVEGKYFAMGSGPMRAAAAKEKLFEEIVSFKDSSEVAVGVIEGKLPPDELCRRIAADCGIRPEALTLLVARTASVAGTLQVVARSVETTLHKLHTLKFNLNNVIRGEGVAPLPDVAKNDLAAIGRTNDAVLYGGDVVLHLYGEDDYLAALGPQVPSSASPSFGEPFSVLFERVGFDFYKLDPLLFSPARVTFVNVNTGRTHTFGAVRPDIFARSADA